MRPRATLLIVLVGLVARGSPGQLASRGTAAVDTIVADQVCSHPRGFVGPCVTVRGRVQTNFDNVLVSLWKVRTSRVLEIQNEVSRIDLSVICSLPGEVYRLLGEAKIVYADFVIRPLTIDRPGVMGYACIASAKNVVARPGGLDHPLFRNPHP